MSPAAENPLALADPSLLVEAAFIGGQWCAADDGATLVVEDPATGRPVGTVPACGAAETRRAIAAAPFAPGARCRPSNGHAFWSDGTI